MDGLDLIGYMFDLLVIVSGCQVGTWGINENKNDNFLVKKWQNEKKDNYYKKMNRNVGMSEMARNAFKLSTMVREILKFRCLKWLEMTKRPITLLHFFLQSHD